MARNGLSQNELSKMVGISRWTYCAMETRKFPMTCATYMALRLVFDNNERTKELLAVLNVFPQELKDIFNANYW